MKERSPIPTPLKLRWREFRIQALPFLIFVGVVIAVAVLWRDQTRPGMLTGEVEGVTGVVTSPSAGGLAQLFIERFDEVEAGQTVGQVIRTPPDVLQSSLAVLKMEIELTRMGWFDPVLDQQRNLLQQEELRLDLLEKRTDLAIRRIELQQAERNEERYSRLHQQGHVSAEQYEQIRDLAEMLRTIVTEQEILVEETDQTLDRLRGGTSEPRADTADAIVAALNLHEERLKLIEAELRPAPLIAPISGMVSMIHRTNRANLAAGETILTIRSGAADQIIAYLKQPLRFEPQLGAQVNVRARNATKSHGIGEIISIGAQVEPLSPAHRTPFFDAYESGLPLLISLPPTLEVRPGEFVDVDIPDMAR